MGKHRSNTAFSVALGGILAALAVVIMCLGGLIPVATFVCPALCILMLKVVCGQCGSRMGWAWYGAVSILCALMSPDKEAAAVFVFLGYYPIVKPRMDKLPVAWLWKLLFFNCAVAVMYYLLLHIFGMTELAQEYAGLGLVMLAVMLLLGNITFFLLDRLLGGRIGRKHG